MKVHFLLCKYNENGGSNYATGHAFEPQALLKGALDTLSRNMSNFYLATGGRKNNNGKTRDLRRHRRFRVTMLLCDLTLKLKLRTLVVNLILSYSVSVCPTRWRLRLEIARIRFVQVSRLRRFVALPPTKTAATHRIGILALFSSRNLRNSRLLLSFNPKSAILISALWYMLLAGRLWRLRQALPPTRRLTVSSGRLRWRLRRLRLRRQRAAHARR